MIGIDWGLFGIGVGAGLVAGALFFAGLALGMRLALRSRHAAVVLLSSSALRILVLLGLGWLVAAQGAVTLVGFAVAFLVARFAATAIARHPPKSEQAR